MNMILPAIASFVLFLIFAFLAIMSGSKRADFWIVSLHFIMKITAVYFSVAFVVTVSKIIMEVLGWNS